MLSEQVLVAYLLETLVGIIVKRGKKYEEDLELTLDFTRGIIIGVICLGLNFWYNMKN